MPLAAQVQVCGLVLDSFSLLSPISKSICRSGRSYLQNTSKAGHLFRPLPLTSCSKQPSFLAWIEAISSKNPLYFLVSLQSVLQPEWSFLSYIRSYHLTAQNHQMAPHLRVVTKVLKMSRALLPLLPHLPPLPLPFNFRCSGLSAPLWVPSCLMVFILVLSAWNGFPSDTVRTSSLHPSVSLHHYLLRAFLDTISSYQHSVSLLLSFPITLPKHSFVYYFHALEYKLLEGRHICLVCRIHSL